MIKKKNSGLNKLGLSAHIIKGGALASAIVVILGLFNWLFPNCKPKPKSDVMKVEFNGAMASQKNSLKQYLEAIGVTESQTIKPNNQGSVSSPATTNPVAPGVHARAGAGQIKKLKRDFSVAELNQAGIRLSVPMKFTGTAGKKYYLEWTLLDGNNIEVYTSKGDFSHEIKIQYQAGDDTFSEIWVPTEGRSGLFLVRVQIFDEHRNPVATKDSEKIQLQ